MLLYRVLLLVFLLVAFSANHSVASLSAVSCGFATQRIQCGDLACSREEKICVPCGADADCYPSAMYCHANGTCKIRGFFSKFSYTALIGLILACLVCSVAVIAGVGGGGILVPMFTGLMNVPMKTAVGLSQSTICGQSTLNVCLLLFKQLPQSNRALINYQYLTLLLPLGLAGTLLGGVFNKMCPDIVRLILLFILLSAVLVKTIIKIRRQFAADKIDREAKIKSPTHPPSPSLPVTNNDEAEEANKEKKPDDGVGREEDCHEPLVDDTNANPPDWRDRFPIVEMVTCIFCFIISLLFQILMHYADCDGTLYWVYFSLLLVGEFSLLAFSWFRLYRINAADPSNLHFKWTTESSTYYLAVAIFAGAAAAMLGLGGGIVLGFVIYDVLAPEEGSATSGTATFFMSFSAAIPEIVSGALPLDYGGVLFVIGLASTALGQFVFMYNIRKYGWRFLILAALAAIVVGSLFALGGYGIYNVINDLDNGSNPFSSGKLCPVKIS